MTETKNFALKLPEPTDMVDIGVLNENFEKIDEELAPFYVLDLLDVITFDLKNNSNADFALSADYADMTDIAALCEAVRAGKNIKLYIKTVEAGALVDVTFEAAVMLSNRKTTDGNVKLFGPLYDSALTTFDRYQVELYVSTDDTVTLSYVDVKELTGGGNAYYELDLRETVVLDIVDRTFKMKELSEEDTDLDALRIAANSGLDIRVQFKFNYWIGEVDANVILTSKSIALADDGAIQHVNYGGCINGLLPDQTVYIVGLVVYNTNIYLSVVRNGDSSVSEPTPTNTAIVKSDSTVTITTTLEGDKQSVTTITVDENDYPTSINVDGTEWPVTWEGFEDAEDTSVGLPVVELSTTIPIDGTEVEFSTDDSAKLTDAASFGMPVCVKTCLKAGEEKIPTSFVATFTGIATEIALSIMLNGVVLQIKCVDDVWTARYGV